MWPPSLQDCSSLDNATWGNIERKACATSPHLGLSKGITIETEWAAMTEAFLVKSYQFFWPRIAAMNQANGGYFEKIDSFGFENSDKNFKCISSLVCEIQ